MMVLFENFSAIRFPVTKSLSQQVSVWLLLYVIGCWMSFDHHPTLLIDVVVSAILLGAYAAAIYVNVLVFVPRLLRRHLHLIYWSTLAASMCVITLGALVLLRLSYSLLLENGGDFLGDFWENYCIDLVGMIVFVGGAAVVVRVMNTAGR